MPLYSIVPLLEMLVRSQFEAGGAKSAAVLRMKSGKLPEGSKTVPSPSPCGSANRIRPLLPIVRMELPVGVPVVVAISSAPSWHVSTPCTLSERPLLHANTEPDVMVRLAPALTCQLHSTLLWFPAVPSSTSGGTV
jgi:hypothetical protein